LPLEKCLISGGNGSEEHALCLLDIFLNEILKNKKFDEMTKIENVRRSTRLEMTTDERNKTIDYNFKLKILILMIVTMNCQVDSGSTIDDDTESEEEAESSKNMMNAKQKKFEDDLVEYLLESKAPFNVVGYKSLSKLINGLDPLIKIPKPSKVSRLVTIKYNKIIKIIIEALTPLSATCLTFALWSQKKSFMGVTVYGFHVNSLERINFTLSCSRFKGPKDHENIYAHLIKIIETFKVQGSLSHIVADSEHSITKMFKEYGSRNNDKLLENILSSTEDLTVKYQQIDELERNKDQLPPHSACKCHLLNLIASLDSIKFAEKNAEFAEAYKSLNDKMEKYWINAKTISFGDLVEKKIERRVSIPNITRWFSRYNAYENLIQLCANSGVMESIFDKFELTFPTDDDFKMIEHYLKIFTPVKIFLKIFEREKQTAYGLLIPTIKQLIDDVNSMEIIQKYEPLRMGILEGIKQR